LLLASGVSGIGGIAVFGNLDSIREAFLRFLRRNARSLEVNVVAGAAPASVSFARVKVVKADCWSVFMWKQRFFLGLSLGVSLLVLIGVLAPATNAAPSKNVTIRLKAVVAYVDNPGDAPLGVAEGSVITGTYTYSLTTPDSNPLIEVADYWHYTAPYGIALDMGDFDTGTDPAQVQFGMELVNNYNGYDGYLLGSYFNTSTGPAVNMIRWELDDPTQTALKKTVLPKTAPVLSAWQSISGLVVDGTYVNPAEPGNVYDWYIQSHVTEAEKI
jgi:hypothetical protein